MIASTYRQEFKCHDKVKEGMAEIQENYRCDSFGKKQVLSEDGTLIAYHSGHEELEPEQKLNNQLP
jgi:hypothetical protein